MWEKLDIGLCVVKVNGEVVAECIGRVADVKVGEARIGLDSERVGCCSCTRVSEEYVRHARKLCTRHLRDSEHKGRK